MVNYNSFKFSENLTRDDQETIRQINETLGKHDLRGGVPKSDFKQWRELIGLQLKHSKKIAVVCEIR